MLKLLFSLSIVLVFNCTFSQKVDRNPQRKVKAENKSTIQKAKENESNPFEIVEDYRKTTIHTDGSKTIVVKFTEISPNQFDKAHQEEQRFPLSSMQWIKSDLQVYLGSLEEKRAVVSSQSEQHELALQNGWYDFLDSVILEARQLLTNL
jgi:hypothetical protein